MRKWVLIIVGVAVVLSCSAEDRRRLVVQGESMAISRLPFVIAIDQGLFERHGLDVELRLRASPFGGVAPSPDVWSRWGRRLGILESPQIEMWMGGATPNAIEYTTNLRAPDLISIAATDCVARAHIIGSPGMRELEDLKGMRIGVGRPTATSGMIARLMAEELGWDDVQDISLISGGQQPDALRSGAVDAIVAMEMTYAVLEREGFPILADTATWDVQLGGNSILVERDWMDQPANRDVARRFLMALAEGVALLHTDRELSLRVLRDWYGIEDSAIAETVYARAAWIPREPFPCREGIENTLALYDSHEMRRHTAADFYDDRIVRDLVQSGFIRKLYR